MLLLKKIKKEYFKIDNDGNTLEKFKFTYLSKKDLQYSYNPLDGLLTKLLNYKQDIFIAHFECDSFNNSLLLKEFDMQKVQNFIKEMRELESFECDTSLQIMGLSIETIAFEFFNAKSNYFKILALKNIQKYIPKLLELQDAGYKLTKSSWSSDGLLIYKNNIWETTNLKDVL